MSEKLKNKIGEELYNKILEKGLKSEEFDIVNDGTWIPKPRFNEVNNKLKAVEEKMQTYETQIKDTELLISKNEELTSSYNALKEQHTNDLVIKDKEITNVSKRFLIEQSLRDSGAKHTSLLMKDIDLEKISVENNNLLGMEAVVESLKTNYSDLFVTKNTTNQTSQSTTANTQTFDSNNVDWGEMLKDIK